MWKKPGDRIFITELDLSNGGAEDLYFLEAGPFPSIYPDVYEIEIYDTSAESGPPRVGIGDSTAVRDELCSDPNFGSTAAWAKTTTASTGTGVVAGATLTISIANSGSVSIK